MNDRNEKKEMGDRNARDRILNVLQGRAPDFVPWFGDLDYWISSMRKRGTLPEEYAGDGYFKLHRDLGVGFYLQGYFPYDTAYEGVEIEEKQEGDVFRRTLRTPVGSLTSEMRYLPDTFSWAHVHHLLKGIDDLPAYLYLVEHTTFAPNYTEAARRKGLVGDNGVVLCYLPRSPFMELVTDVAGLENLVFLMADWPEETTRLLEAMEIQADLAAEIALASPAECLMIPENLSSEMVGADYYLRFLRPYEKKWTDRIRAAGKFSFIHMDGTLQGLIRLVAESGFDVLEALTPLPSGDMSWAEIAEAVPSGPILWGGLPGVLFTPHVSDEEFEAHLEGILETMRTSRRFVLGVADQVPPDAIWSRVAKIHERVEEFGRMERNA